MPHIHQLIDFTVGGLIVRGRKILLVHHKGIGKWLTPGGHIELHEDPEEALHREIREETGLEVEIVGVRHQTKDDNSKSLIAPHYMDIHGITPTHRHVGMYYLCRPVGGVERLSPEEHHDLRWFTEEELYGLDMWPATLYYAVWAIDAIGEG